MLLDEIRNAKPIMVARFSRLGDWVLCHGLVNIVKEVVAEVDVAHLFVDFGELAENAVEPIVEILQAAGQRGQNHLVQDFGRGVKAHRRVDHQHFFKIESALFLVQFGNKCRFGSPQAVAGQVELRNLDPVLDLLPGHGHHPVQINRVGDDVAGQARRRGGGDKIHAGGRGQADHVEPGLIEDPLKKDHVGGVKTAAGSGNDENQRRFALLVGQRIAKLPLIPEDIGDDAFGKHLEAQHLIVDLLRQLRLELRRGTDNRRQVGILQRVVVGTRLAPGTPQQKYKEHKP